MEQMFTDTLNTILINTEKKKVQSLCKKLLKKCNFKSKNDLAMLSELGYWLYVYGYKDEAVQVCELFDGIEFIGNYDIWNQADYAFCLKIRILREEGKSERIKELLAKVNEHRNPELYENGIKWYRETVNANIKSDDDYHPGKINPGWRMIKLKHAIFYREGGNHPIPDEEFENDIHILCEELQQVR